MNAAPHPVVQAFAKAQYGSLHFVAPDGAAHDFKGPEAGFAADLTLHNGQALNSLLAEGEKGFAASYGAGGWDSHNLPALLSWGLQNAASLEKFFYGRPLYALLTRLKHLFVTNTRAQSIKNVLAHYDLGNEFYGLWLDKSMTYSCALFEDDPSRTLEEAQTAKYNRILGKLNLKPGAEILEIGCGWGGFAEIAAKQSFRVKGLTLSNAQAAFATERLARQSLDKLASIHLTDYREIEGQYDGIASIGMFEHVGQEWWPAYFHTVRRCLKLGATAMVQSIILKDEDFERLKGHYGVIEETIFPGGMLSSRRRFVEAAEKAGLSVKETFTFGPNYARTLREWMRRFEAQREKVKSLGHDEKFIRLWRFYLSACIASFETGRSSVMQAELRQA